MTYTHQMIPLAYAYDTLAIEQKWQREWISRNTYAWDESVARADSYVIDTPPPTVSGTLHMGHVFSYTQADFIARYQRMRGKNVFYPMGFDDNGLPTERLVEKVKKIRAVDKTREDFIAECLQVSEEARKEFRALFESIALSVDWAQEYHTISDDARRLSQMSFLDLIEKEQCYRAIRPFYWDPVDQTAIASAEIEDKQIASFENVILFKILETNSPFAGESANLSEPVRGRVIHEIPSHESADADSAPPQGGSESLHIMTTRPELLPACVALFCHPEDNRYTHLHGKHAIVPLFGFPVPILTDATVEPEKGTGLMMCCTFGDEADIVKWQKHGLPARVVLNKFGKMDLSDLFPSVTPAQAGVHLDKNNMDSGFRRNDNVIAALQNKKVSNTDPKHPGARQVIIELLKEAGLLLASKPITHAVKCAERSGAPLEILPTHQWFIKVTDKKEALKARARECTWNPDWMRLRIEQWIDGLNQDWCISRQRYFGVPFPVWYEQPTGKSTQPTAIYARAEDLPVNPLVDVPHGYEKLAQLEGLSFRARRLSDGMEMTITPDPDVMDTWATSSISPQLSAGRISGHVIPGQARDDASHSRFHSLFPADLRPQAHEIIRTWAFYTIVKAHLHNDSIPWKNLMISGWCLAEDKSKMSKSKGNVVTPVALIEDKGADAVRYWAATSRLGQDTAFSPDLLKIGKKLVNKLWNATQFAAIHLAHMQSPASTPTEEGGISETLDRWILSRLGETVAKATTAYDTYEYAEALDATNQFFWADFCDNYLELIKKRIYNEDGSISDAARQSAIRAVYYCLEGILKLYAPVLPHVTEELYSHIFAEDYAARGSLHARGQWPNTKDYFIDAEALIAGRQAVEVLGFIRNAKSVGNVSIKYPVATLTLNRKDYPQAQSWLADVCGAGNVRDVVLSESAGENPIALTLADQAEVV